jgi:hypothetical protein
MALSQWAMPSDAKSCKLRDRADRLGQPPEARSVPTSPNAGGRKCLLGGRDLRRPPNDASTGKRASATANAHRAALTASEHPRACRQGIARPGFTPFFGVQGIADPVRSATAGSRFDPPPRDRNLAENVANAARGETRSNFSRRYCVTSWPTSVPCRCRQNESSSSSIACVSTERAQGCPAAQPADLRTCATGQQDPATSQGGIELRRR